MQVENAEAGLVLGIVSMALHIVSALLKYYNHSHVTSECCGARASADLRMEDSPLIDVPV